MAAYTVETRRIPDQVIELAIAYFGEGGLGLSAEYLGPCCAYFQNGEGFVRVEARKGQGRTKVDLETRDWDYDVRQFMRRLA
jgi:hypothetical protein